MNPNLQQNSFNFNYYNYNNNNSNNNFPFPQNTSNQQLSWFEFRTKNKPQSNAIAGASMFLIASGIHMAWDTFISTGIDWIPMDPVSFDRNIFKYQRFGYLCWIIGILVGATLSCFFVTKFRKHIIYYISGGSFVLSGILFIGFYDCLISILIGRCLAGIGFGLTFLTIIIHIPEITIKQLRGQLLSTIILLLTAGMLNIVIWSDVIQLINYDTINDTTSIKEAMNLEKLVGIHVVVFSLLGLLLLPFLTYESPIYLIQHQQEQLALTTMMKLRTESVESYETRRDFNEFQAILNNEANKNSLIFTHDNIKSLILILLLRILYLISISQPLLLIFNVISIMNRVDFSLTILITIKFVAELINSILVEKIGRKKFLFLSTISSGFILLIIGFLHFILINNNTKILFIIEFILICFYQFFISLGLGNISVIYLGEAFLLCKKSFSIQFIIIFENLINILLYFIIPFDYILNFYLIVFFIGIIEIIFGLYFYKKLPETKNLTLKECQEKFQ